MTAAESIPLINSNILTRPRIRQIAILIRQFWQFWRALLQRRRPLRVPIAILGINHRPRIKLVINLVCSFVYILLWRKFLPDRNIWIDLTFLHAHFLLMLHAFDFECGETGLIRSCISLLHCLRQPIAFVTLNLIWILLFHWRRQFFRLRFHISLQIGHWESRFGPMHLPEAGLIIQLCPGAHFILKSLILILVGRCSLLSADHVQWQNAIELAVLWIRWQRTPIPPLLRLATLAHRPPLLLQHMFLSKTIRGLPRSVVHLN